ncbi:hypothetical protein CMEL01_05314 [Colletotrichum melonis]|uniref:Uncharacterized protein n=1 Tax=Colletotrichum melonis TaxID=1209925 RepID=A0AAI9U8F9_9PEZI|nr:hypothetical protein CMEL01_05314 [Colletotrichum melonis]
MFGAVVGSTGWMEGGTKDIWDGTPPPGEAHASFAVADGEALDEESHGVSIAQCGLVPRFPLLANPGQGPTASLENATTSRGLCVTALDAGHGSSDKTDLTARGRRGHGVEWKGMQADNLGGKVHPS